MHVGGWLGTGRVWGGRALKVGGRRACCHVDIDAVLRDRPDRGLGSPISVPNLLRSETRTVRIRGESRDVSAKFEPTGGP